jgi:hypothetical protein
MSIFSNRYSDAKQEAGDYTQAVLGLVGNRDPISILEKTPGEVARIVAGLPPSELARPEAPGRWSMLHVVRHLGDSELVWAYRFRRILAEDRPRIEGYDQDQWADRLHYDRADATEAITELRALRTGTLRLIRALDASDLRRVGVHSERGEESIEHQIRMYAGHDVLHLNQLARIRDTLGLRSPA